MASLSLHGSLVVILAIVAAGADGMLHSTPPSIPSLSNNQNGLQQRLNSWQDGVSGTNCPIQPGSNWTYQFQTKDQIGTFFYFPSINFQKAAGGFGAIRVNNRVVIAVPFDRPDNEFDLLIGDWFYDNYQALPDIMLMNGKGPYGHKLTKDYESFTVTSGKTYRFRISNVGTALNNVSYITPETPLKLADQFDNGSGVYQLDWFPTKSVNQQAAHGVSVVSGTHKGWIELVLLNAMDELVLGSGNVHSSTR
ncbi:Monocopper oxidase-like protein SKU5 [Linum grandiflorum]